MIVFALSNFMLLINIKLSAGAFVNLGKYKYSDAPLSFFSWFYSYESKMSVKKFLKLLCVITFITKVAARPKFDAARLNQTLLKKPHFATGNPFWDPDFCDDWEELDAFPHPDSCKDYLICFNGELWEQTCEPGMLFDPWDAVCDDADFVTCLDDTPGPPDHIGVRYEIFRLKCFAHILNHSRNVLHQEPTRLCSCLRIIATSFTYA